MWLFLNIKSYLFLLLAFLARKSEQTGSNPSCNVTGSPHIESISIQLDPLGGDQVSLIINWNSSSTNSSGSLFGTDSNVTGYINTTNSTFERTGNLNDTYTLQITENGGPSENCSILLENPYNLSCSVVNSSKFNLSLLSPSFDLNNHSFTDLIGRSPPDGSSNATQTGVIAFDGLSAGYQFVVNLNVTDNSTGVQYVIYHTDNQCSTTPGDCNVTSNEDLDSIIVTRESKSSEVHNIRMQMTSVASQCCQYANETVNSSYSLEARSTNEFYSDADIFFQCEARNDILGLNNNATCASNETSLVIEPKPESGMTTIFANISKDGENTGLQSQTGGSSFQFLDLEPETSFEVALHMTSNTTGINHILLVQCNTTAVIAPTNLNFTDVTKTSFTVTWDYSGGDADNFVLICITPGCVGNDNISANTRSYSVENLTPNAQYQVELKAEIGGYDSSLIDGNQSTNPVPVPEEFISSTKNESSITLAWNTSDTDIETFELSCPSSASNCPLDTNPLETTGLNYQVNNLDAGQQYFFRIRAKFVTQLQNFYSIYSDEFSVFTYDVPASLTVAPSELGTSYNISWTYLNSGGGEALRFILSCEPNCGSDRNISTAFRSDIWNNLSRGINYTFSLRADYNNHITDAITAIGTPSDLPIPSNLGSDAKNSSTVNLKWDFSLENSNNVYFQVSCTNNTVCDAKIVTGTEYAYSGLTPGQLYTFQVQTKVEDDLSDPSNTFIVRTNLNAPDLSNIQADTSNEIPLPVISCDDQGQIVQVVSNAEVHWGQKDSSAPCNDRNYRNSENFTVSQNPCQQSFTFNPTTVTGINFGDEICLKLMLMSNQGGYEERSESIANVYLYPAKVSGLSCNNSVNHSLTFSWNREGTVDHFLTKLDNQNENQIASATKTYPNLDHGTKYTLSIRAVSNNLRSKAETLSCRTKIDVPMYTVDVTADFKVRIQTNVQSFNDEMIMNLYLIDDQDLTSCQNYTNPINQKTYRNISDNISFEFNYAVVPGRPYCTKVWLLANNPDEDNFKYQMIIIPLSLQINSVASTSIVATFGNEPTFTYTALTYRVIYFEVEDNSEQVIRSSATTFGQHSINDLIPGARSQMIVTLTTSTGKQVSVESEIFHTIPALPTVENAESKSDRCSFTLRADQIVTSFKVDFNGQESQDEVATGSASFIFTELQPHHNYSFSISSISNYSSNATESSAITHRCETKHAPPHVVTNPFIVRNLETGSFRVTWRPPVVTNGPLRGYIITVNWSRADSGSRLDNTQTQMFSVGNDASEVPVFVPEGYRIDVEYYAYNDVPGLKTWQWANRPIESEPEINTEYKNTEDLDFLSSRNKTSLTLKFPCDLFQSPPNNLSQQDNAVNPVEFFEIAATENGVGPYIASDQFYPTDECPKVPRMGREPRSAEQATWEFTLGSNEGCNDNSTVYCNKELQSGTMYEIFLRAYADEKTFKIFEAGSYKTADGNGLTAGAIVGILIALLLLLLIVLLVTFFIWRNVNKKKDDTHDPSLDPFSVPNPTCRRLKPDELLVKFRKPIQLDQFRDECERLASNDNAGFVREFLEVQYEMREPGIPRQIGIWPENQSKNRYKDIVPFDPRLVRIEGGYVNASYISGENSDQEYIASQGPLPHTVDDFWQMIWEKDVVKVVMLCQCQEMKKGVMRDACFPYWPNEMSEAQWRGNLQIKLIDIQATPFWIRRTFTIRPGDPAGYVSQEEFPSGRNIVQYHFKRWEDEMTPLWSEFEPFVTVIRKENPYQYPVLVHCSAGVGRTGSFIAVDRLMQQKTYKNEFDIRGMVAEMRTMRPLMVQTVEQYRFVHEVALRLAEEVQNVMPNGPSTPLIAPTPIGFETIELTDQSSEHNADVPSNTVEIGETILSI
ncbi:receptor-type tyrosine-protein phosphatase beta-like isoform X2 [Symsagittifera roscoffensis]|uniref:receptor-type tyrosine-protein phosphatase beta-like isoform X2 n=1 Tax=Symsagittifera roscoffensis TaxID=84072 RepID=UPI00307BBB13